MRLIRRHLTFANVASFLALFIVLTGGTAVALTGSNTVQSDDLGPGAQVKAPDVAANAVNGSDVVDNSIASADILDSSLGNGDFLTGSVNSRVVTDNELTGTDINEASLGQVPSALLGGFGRWGTNDGQCNPTSTTFIACAVVTPTLPAQARLLLIAQASGLLVTGSSAVGKCRIGTTSGSLLDTETSVVVTTGAPSQNVSLVGITGPFPPGQHSFGIDCNQQSGQITYANAGIAAVAISPD